MNHPREVLTIGHSNHSMESFLALLGNAGVTAVADVRSAPYSRHAPQFNHEALRLALRAAGIGHAQLGAALGGRPHDLALYRNGVADYEKIAAGEAFQAALRRVLAGAATHRIALMCAEQYPQHCHRCLLIGRALARQDICVRHILPDGATVSQTEIEAELLRRSARDVPDLFLSAGERLAAAYRDHTRKAALPGKP